MQPVAYVFVAVVVGLVLADETEESKEIDDSWCYAPSENCNQGPKGKSCGPNEWGKVAGFAACSEKGTQSPIDMTGAAKLESQGFKFTTRGKSEKATYMLNEHTAEVELTPQDQEYELNWNNKKYKLLQFHYHSPSENVWDGKYFAMEAHYVHKSDDGEFVVLATMIGVKSGDSTANTFLQNVLEKTPKPRSGDTDDNLHVLEDAEFNMDAYDFMPKSLLDSHWFFEGSMTTPGCTAGVHWIMSPEPVYVTQETLNYYRNTIHSNPNGQLAPFGTIVGKGASSPPSFHSCAGSIAWTTKIGSNNRPLQPLRGKDNQDRMLYFIGEPVSCGGGGGWMLKILAAIVGIVIGCLFCNCRKGKSDANGREPVLGTQLLA